MERRNYSAPTISATDLMVDSSLWVCLICYPIV